MKVGASQPPRLPDEQTILTVLDDAARSALVDVGELVDQAIHAEGPRRTDALVDGFITTPTKTPEGHRLRVRPSPRKRHGKATVAQVARWVNRGTGTLRVGPGPKKRIVSRQPGLAMQVGSGVARRSVAGQAANPFVERADDRTSIAAQVRIEQGADLAAWALGKLT